MGADAVLAEVSGVPINVRRITRRFAMSVVAGALAASVLVHAQGRPDPFVGIWKLDVDSSVFDPGPPPISRTMTIVPVDNGMTHQIDSMVPLSGMTKTAVNFSYTAKFDGTDAPVMGSSNLETVSIRRVDARTIERTGKTRGMVTETCTMKLSPDGKRLTMVIKGSGEVAYGSTQVFDRQAAPK
jgi:hypothetical protein